MKIKKKEYKERIQLAYKAGMRTALERPTDARLYLQGDKMKDALMGLSELQNIFNK